MTVYIRTNPTPSLVDEKSTKFAIATYCGKVMIYDDTRMDSCNHASTSCTKSRGGKKVKNGIDKRADAGYETQQG
jgi:hypothetical protein